MNHKEKLLEIYSKSDDILNINLTAQDKKHLDLVVGNISRNKGVYTVLVTLLTHKIIDPKQDIRYFQVKMKNGFSGRGIDTKYITPTLKELGLPSMAESGWLTRSLEQPYPYTKNYEGKISGKGMKEAFLMIIDSFENNPLLSEIFLRYILYYAIKERESNRVNINKLENTEDIFISNIIEILDEHFSFNYGVHGGSKLPVIAFYSIYKILINELKRFNNCSLLEFGSHTASDRTSESSGDIEVKRNNNIFESVEIKLDKKIDANMTRIAYEKIVRFNIERYYILSYHGIKQTDKKEITNIIKQVRDEQGCQIIVNSLLRTVRYYLRLISSPLDFFNDYIKLVEQDQELQRSHKEKLKEIINKFQILTP